VISTISDINAVQPDSPDTGSDSNNLRIREKRGQVKADVVCSIGRMVDLVIDAQEAFVGKLSILDELAGLNWANPLSSWWTN
jgi:hypothetical protein